MTLRQDNGYDFIELSHGEKGFLMDHAAFFAGIHLNKPEPLPPEAGPYPPFLSMVMSYNDRKFLLFDLEGYLHELFHTQESKRPKVALMGKTDSFPPHRMETIGELVRKWAPGASESGLAYRVGSEIQICHLTERELRLLPGRVGSALGRLGIKGCRFRDSHRIDYIIDPADLLFAYLEKQRKGEGIHENTDR